MISALVLLLLQSDPQTCKPCAPSDSGLRLTESFEGYRAFEYGDPVGIRTVGFGHMVRPGETFPEPLLPPDAYILLKKDANRASGVINRSVAIPLHQNQFDALNDFVFNTGTLGKALPKKINNGQHKEVPKELERWSYAKGLRLKGLERRRKAEGDLYGRPD